MTRDQCQRYLLAIQIPIFKRHWSGINHYATRVRNARSIVSLSTTGYYASPSYSVYSHSQIMTDPRSGLLIPGPLTVYTAGTITEAMATTDQGSVIRSLRRDLVRNLSTKITNPRSNIAQDMTLYDMSADSILDQGSVLIVHCTKTATNSGVMYSTTRSCPS